MSLTQARILLAEFEAADRKAAAWQGYCNALGYAATQGDEQAAKRLEQMF